MVDENGIDCIEDIDEIRYKTDKGAPLLTKIKIPRVGFPRFSGTKAKVVISFLFLHC